MADSAYRKALDTLLDRVDALHELMHDGFKAPEETIFALPQVQLAMWEAQVQYAAMMRKDGDD